MSSSKLLLVFWLCTLPFCCCSLYPIRSPLLLVHQLYRWAIHPSHWSSLRIVGREVCWPAIFKKIFKNRVKSPVFLDVLGQRVVPPNIPSRDIVESVRDYSSAWTSDCILVRKPSTHRSSSRHVDASTGGKRLNDRPSNFQLLSTS